MSTTETLPTEKKEMTPAIEQRLRDSSARSDHYLDRLEASMAMAESRLAEAVEAFEPAPQEKRTSLAVSVVLFVCGCVYFRRVEKSFADIA